MLIAEGIHSSRRASHLHTHRLAHVLVCLKADLEQEHIIRPLTHQLAQLQLEMGKRSGQHQ